MAFFSSDNKDEGKGAKWKFILIDKRYTYSCQLFITAFPF